MKSERRHQLERNELADHLGAGVTAVQPVLPFILGGLAILAVGSVAWGIVSSSAKKREAVAWTDFYFNLADGDAEDFMNVADEFPKSKASGWALQTAGDSYLAQGINALYDDRKEGEEKIRQAMEAFEDVLSGSPDDSLRSKALIGLGQAQESLGELDEAIGNYQQVLTTTSLPPRVLSAVGERVAFLNSASGKEFYKWFSELDPKPDAAIDLGDLSVPPTLQGDGLEFATPTGGTVDAPPVMPELDLKDLGLPEIDSPPVPDASAVDELKLPELDTPQEDKKTGGPETSDDSQSNSAQNESTSAEASTADTTGAGTASGKNDQ